MNPMTTIRVEASVRDRLAVLAEAHGRSPGAEPAAILDDLEWEAIEAGYRRLAANPDDLAAYLAEAEAFSRLDLRDLADTAAEEYPEYNGGAAGTRATSCSRIGTPPEAVSRAGGAPSSSYPTSATRSSPACSWPCPSPAPTV